MNPDLERLIGRAVTDKAFRDKLLADPEATIQDAGLKLSDEELARLKATIQKADAEQLDQQLIGISGHW